MPTLSVVQTVTAPGVATQQVSTTVTTDNMVQSIAEVPVAKAGALTTRTDNDTGVLTMSGGHGLITGKIDLYWDTGSRRGMDGVVTVNSIAIDGGSGDNLPALVSGTYAIIAANPHEEAIVAVGDNVDGIVISSDRRGHVVLAQANGTVIKAVEFGTDGDTYYWIDDSGFDNPTLVTNPLAGATVGKVFASHDDVDAAHSPAITLLYS